MAKGNVFTGARAKFSINSVKVGYATNCSGSEEVVYEPVEVLDNIEVEEFVPVAYRVNFTAGRVRIIGETLKSAGWFPKNGANPSEHLQEILKTGDLTCTIEDSKTGKAFMTLEQVKAASHNWAVNARGIVAEDMAFVAIRMRDESEIP